MVLLFYRCCGRSLPGVMSGVCADEACFRTVICAVWRVCLGMNLSLLVNGSSGWDIWHDCTCLGMSSETAVLAFTSVFVSRKLSMGCHLLDCQVYSCFIRQVASFTAGRWMQSAFIASEVFFPVTGVFKTVTFTPSSMLADW